MASIIGLLLVWSIWGDLKVAIYVGIGFAICKALLKK